MIHITSRAKIFFILWAASFLGSFAILPFLFLVQGNLFDALGISSVMVVVLHVGQSAVVFGAAGFCGLFFAEKVGFRMPILEAWAQHKPKKIIQKAVVGSLIVAIPFGFLAGFLVLVADSIVPLLAQNSLEISVGPASFSVNALTLPSESLGITSITPAAWKGFFASLYGGINEEIAMRLFAMSFLVWVCSFFARRKGKKISLWMIWVGILGAAVLFGIGHLPFTATLTGLSAYIVARALLLNGLAGIVFGWLFWKKGLEAAMVAHITADIFLFVIVPVFG